MEELQKEIHEEVKGIMGDRTNAVSYQDAFNACVIKRLAEAIEERNEIKQIFEDLNPSLS